MSDALLLIPLAWLVGYALARWLAHEQRRTRLVQKRFHRLLHRARDSELRTHRLWIFIVLSSKAKRAIYPLNAQTLARERVEAGGRN